MKLQRTIILLGTIMTIMSLGACAWSDSSAGNNAQGNNGVAAPETASADVQKADTGFVLAGPDSYDSADTAVLVHKNKDDSTVTLLNLDLGRQYTLIVEGTTTLYDKYGEAVSLDQIEEGDIVDVTFLKSKKRLNSMKLSDQAWEYQEVNRYEIDTTRHAITIGGDIYKITEDTVFLSESREIELMDLNASDTITVRGLDNRALSISVDKGHGYLRLTNDENFVGGWIEIGQSQVSRITEGMLLTVPEGSYQVVISHNGGGGTKNLTIRRNEEVTLDIGDLQVAETKFGTVIFSLSPSSLTLYVDGSQVDTSGPVTLEYGIHQLIAKADGYKSITTYMKVGQESAGIDITLEATDSEEDSDSTDSDDTTTVTSYYKVYVDAPEDVEVYVDGSYMGIAPCNFRKTSGTHTITLRKSGYETRSYTVEIDEEEKDISYSFAELTATTTGSSNTSSN